MNMDKYREIKKGTTSRFLIGCEALLLIVCMFSVMINCCTINADISSYSCWVSCLYYVTMNFESV